MGGFLGFLKFWFIKYNFRKPKLRKVFMGTRGIDENISCFF